MAKEGVEPSHPNGYQILSLARLPIPPLSRKWFFAGFSPRWSIFARFFILKVRTTHKDVKTTKGCEAKERRGFEPLHGIDRLSVFETELFSHLSTFPCWCFAISAYWRCRRLPTIPACDLQHQKVHASSWPRTTYKPRPFGHHLKFSVWPSQQEALQLSHAGGGASQSHVPSLGG